MRNVAVVFKSATAALGCAAATTAVSAYADTNNDPAQECVPPTQINAYAKAEADARVHWEGGPTELVKPKATLVMNKKEGVQGTVNFRDCTDEIYVRYERSNIDRIYGDEQRHFDALFVNKTGAERSGLPFLASGTAGPEALRREELTQNMLGIDKPLATVGAGKVMPLGTFAGTSFYAGGMAGVSRQQASYDHGTHNGALVSVGADVQHNGAVAGVQYLQNQAEGRKIARAYVDAPWQVASFLKLDAGAEVSRMTTPLEGLGDASHVTRHIRALHLDATVRLASSWNLTLSAATVKESAPPVPLTTVVTYGQIVNYVRDNKAAFNGAVNNVWNTNLHGDLVNAVNAEGAALKAIGDNAPYNFQNVSLNGVQSLQDLRNLGNTLKGEVNADVKAVVPELKANLDNFGAQLMTTVKNDVTNNQAMRDFAERMGEMLATNNNPTVALPGYQSDVRNQSHKLVEARLCYHPEQSGFSGWLSLRADRVAGTVNDGGHFDIAPEMLTAAGHTVKVKGMSVFDYGPTSARRMVPGVQVGLNYAF